MHNTPFLVIVEFVIIFLTWIFIRLLPHYFAPHGMGVDHWFWKAYIEKYQQEGKFPPSLPQFILDEQQWYPPLFPLLVSRLPQTFFERYSWLIANAIDLARMILAMVFVFFISGGRTTPTLAAGVVYAMTPILISYNVQLNPRGLGALFLDVVIALLILVIWHSAPWWIWIFIVFFSGLILLTHKMTTQLFWFLCLGVGALKADWRQPLLIPISIIAALILSRGFYIKVLRAHWDIVRFWKRNWPWLSSHSVRESPIYGLPGYETPTKYFASGFKGFFRRMLYIIGFNPWVWSLLIAAHFMLGPNTRLTPEDIWMIRWLTSILLFVLLTTFVPFLRCLGNGHLYLYNSSFPAALLAGMIWGGLKHDTLVNLIASITLFLCIFGIAFYLLMLFKSKTLKIDKYMDEALRHLKLLPNGVTMCFPQHWHDVVSYKAAKPVLFGGHGYGFKLLESVFPRLTKPISELINKYKVKYLLTYEGYLPENFLRELPSTDIEEFGQYRLYKF